MTKNQMPGCGRPPGVYGLGLVCLLLVALALGGCATHRMGAAGPRAPEAIGGGGEAEPLLAPFLVCTSPAQFVQAQRGVDMVRLVESLEDGAAVRLGALGPLPAPAAAVLNHKRASYLVTVTREYGARARRGVRPLRPPHGR